MDDGMNDDVAASRTTPSDNKQQQPDTPSRRFSEGHFQGFKRGGNKSHGIFSKEGKIGKYFATEGGDKEHEESKAGASRKGIDRSELYGGYGA